ncbi:MAG: endonuclease/exonuclease/phosphatase family protein [Candidatus Riflebacteria bacterium]|nr:endonuclease/exonuclease/phosphatase family protein [Candidatus Riflebacteria bacterium]
MLEPMATPATSPDPVVEPASSGVPAVASSAPAVAGAAQPIGWRERSWRMWFAFGFLLAAASLFGFAGEAWWVFDVLAHFRVQYALGLTIIAPTALLTRRWKTALALALLAVVNIAQVWPYLEAGPAGPPPPGRTWRGLAINVHTHNRRSDLVRDLIHERRPDLLVLTEVDDRWLGELAPLHDEFPYRTVHPRGDNFGIAFFSRLPPRSLAVRFFPADSTLPSIVGEFEMGSATLTVLGTHPLPPRKPDYAAGRDAQFAAMGDFLAGVPGPKLVLGDLNSTPWSAPFQRFLEQGGLRDSAVGWGIHPTWPTTVPLFWSPIDHALVSPHLAVVGRRVGGFVGSDHFPVEIDFALNPAP